MSPTREAQVGRERDRARDIAAALFDEAIAAEGVIGGARRLADSLVQYAMTAPIIAIDTANLRAALARYDQVTKR